MLSLGLISTFFLGDIKAEVARAKKEVEVSSDVSRAKVALAKALWHDQDQEGAFRVFVEALDLETAVQGGKVRQDFELESPTSSIAMSPEEEEVYKKALGRYLGHRPEEAKEAARAIHGQFSSMMEAHPEWYHLGFVMAAAKANLSDFDSFFDLFYASFRHNPTHFLASKTRAILHVKLFERARSKEERERQRALVLDFLHQAEKAFPGDFSLYGIQIAFSAPEQKEAIKREILNKILSLSMIPSRADTLYFLKMAYSSGDKNLIKLWEKEVLKWYPDSRSLKECLQLNEENGNQNAR